MRRKLFNILTALSIVLFVATVALWMRSYARLDLVQRWYAQGADVVVSQLDPATRAAVGSAVTRDSSELRNTVWYERTDSDFMLSSEFNHLRAEDQDLGGEAKFAELRRLYEAKVAASGVPRDVQAMVALYFDELGRAIRSTEQAR